MIYFGNALIDEGSSHIYWLNQVKNQSPDQANHLGADIPRLQYRLGTDSEYSKESEN